jgi:hypothetical protein
MFFHHSSFLIFTQIPLYAWVGYVTCWNINNYIHSAVLWVYWTGFLYLACPIYIVGKIHKSEYRKNNRYFPLKQKFWMKSFNSVGFCKDVFFIFHIKLTVIDTTVLWPMGTVYIKQLVIVHWFMRQQNHSKKQEDCKVI